MVALGEREDIMTLLDLMADGKSTLAGDIERLREMQRMYGGRIWFPDDLGESAVWYSAKWLPTEILMRVKGGGELRYQ